MEVVSFTPRPVYPQGKGPWYPLDRGLAGSWVNYTIMNIYKKPITKSNSQIYDCICYKISLFWWNFQQETSIVQYCILLLVGYKCKECLQFTENGRVCFEHVIVHWTFLIGPSCISLCSAANFVMFISLLNCAICILVEFHTFILNVLFSSSWVMGW